MVDMCSRYGALKIAKSAILRELGEYYETISFFGQNMALGDTVCPYSVF